MNKEIATLLDSYNSIALWDMARAAQLPNTTGKKLSKGELLVLMAQEFFKPERIKAVYQRLTKTERDVLNRLLLHNGRVSSRQFARELIRADLVTEAPPPEPKKQDYWYERSNSIYGRTVNHIGSAANLNSRIYEDVVARLTLYGLVFSEDSSVTTGETSYKLQLHPGDTLFVPTFVSRHLPQPDPIPVEVKNWEPTHVLHGDPQLLLRDLYLYWDTVRRSPVDMIKAGFVGKRGLARLNAALLTPDPTVDKVKQEDQTGRLYLLRQILQELKLVKPQNDALHANTSSSRAIPEFWRKSMAEQVTAVLAVWRTLPHPFRFTHKQAYYQFEPNMRQACQLLLTMLSKMPADAWIEGEEVLIGLQEQSGNFLFTERSYFESSRTYYGSPHKTLAEMDKLEKAFVAQVMAHFLLEIGLVELGYNSQPTNPADWYAYRLTPLGTAVLHNKPFPSDVTGQVTGQVIIQPNFQILAMGPVPMNVLAQLDLSAERQKVDRSAFEYHLSRQSVYAAQQMGYAVAEVQRFLETATPHDLPQNIHRSLAEWAAHHDRIVFRRGVTLLQAADEALLERLLNGAETGKLLARPVGNQVALVKSKQQEKLVSALRKEGLLPAVSGANPEAADKSVVVAENGRIQPIHAVPSLHLSGRLAHFAIESEGGWQLTAQSVSRAGGNKENTQSIVDELKKLNRGRLPKQLVEQIRAWGGYYGPATVGTLTLFEFRDQETLAELRDLPELRELLQPFAAGNRALAVVAEEEVTAVQAILSRLGVQVVAQ